MHVGRGIASRVTLSSFLWSQAFGTVKNSAGAEPHDTFYLTPYDAVRRPTDQDGGLPLEGSLLSNISFANI